MKSEQPFRRIAIVNRGEPAMRLIHAVRELSAEEGSELVTIALFTDADRDSLFVREADESHRLGPAFFTDPADGESKSGYLDYEGLERALVATGAEAVWVGWGFVAEHAAFAELCERRGITFIGPSGAVMRRLGDKISAKRLAEEAEVPVAPWSGGPVESVDEAVAIAGRLGYPVMIKATAGGGGRGIRRISADDELAAALPSARSEARKAFGDPTVFIEKAVTGARHVEVQVIADRHGTTWALGVRDCTLQRRNQKVMEETPSPALTPEQDGELRAAAARLAATAGYRNAGTVEFLYDPEVAELYFMEVNTRLQVEHPVTEEVTGVDLVKWQIRVARGERLPEETPASRGHAIEVRLNAEDPDQGFAPAPGRIELLTLPTGPGLRIDSGFAEGDTVAPEFDSMIAKLIASGTDREEAMSRLRRALRQTQVVIRGGTTNKGFLTTLLARPEVASGEMEVGWLDGLVARGGHLVRRRPGIALLTAAIDAYEAASGLEKGRFFASARRGRPEVEPELGQSVELGYQGQRYSLRVLRHGARRYRVELDGQVIELRRERRGAHEHELGCAGRTYRISSVRHGFEHLVEIDGEPYRISGDQAGKVRSPAPAMVVGLSVEEGDEVEVGDRLLVLEAMKMEMSITASVAGRVRRVRVRRNVQVGAGQALVEIEPAGTAAATSQDRLDLTELLGAAAPEPGCAATLGSLEQLVKGYDVDPGEIHRLVGEHGLLCRGTAPDDPDLLAAEDRVLALFADISALFRRQPSDLEPFAEEARHSAREYLFDYLRDLDSGAEELPAGFRHKLVRCLAHFGVEELERSPELEEALFRICKSQERMDGQLAPILSILDRRLAAAGALRPASDGEDKALLDRIIEHTRGRYPAVHDLAREVRYRFFHQPFLDSLQERVYRRAEESLAALTSLDERHREAAINDLVDCPQPLHGFLAARFEGGPPTLRQRMLEVTIRRYYRIRDLRSVETGTSGEHEYATCLYSHGDDEIRLLATRARWAELPGALRDLVPLLEETPEQHDLVVEVYLWREGGLGTPDDNLAEIRAAVADVPLPRELRRLVVTVAAPESGHGLGAVHHFTLRPGADGYQEETLYRGLHPMMGKRLKLWRLANFELERLESAEDIYLFRATARENPRDDRLFALAEVRDLTPWEAPDGSVQFPHLERMVMETLAGIRLFQSRQEPRRRLFWNRVVLYVWPPLELDPAAIRRLAERFAPATADLGLEKVSVRARVPDPDGGGLVDRVIDISSPGGRGLLVRTRPPAEEAIQPLDDYHQKVVRLQRRGLTYPYEIVRMLTRRDGAAEGTLPPGEFREYDLDGENRPVPVDRPWGENTCNIVLGVIRNSTPRVPEGMARVVLLSDPTRGMGNLAEAECRRIDAAMALAEEMGLPLEWFAVSAGAKIAMDSGTENMDWIGLVLRRIVEFTQRGGEINIVVTGINVGAQPYWNAEATMLMHTRGILIMMPESAMVLTGKQALDYSGGVSAEDNQGIGGYERIMGPNGQAQYFARDLDDACRTLLRWYDHTWRAPGERFPRRAETSDPVDRDVRPYPHGGEFESVGEIFSDRTNPGRKRPFDIRRVMMAAVDQDHPPLERWFGMQHAEVAVVWDAHLGGWPVCLLGFESRPLPRFGFVPVDGPDQWTSGTLFPVASKKIARAINSASGNRPLVVLANLSGFDGSPESMRRWQLEFGAEIGRAVVNFDGPIVFVDISRYHGGAFVVFSNALNGNMEVAALEGTYASVIGGAPAAAVVFAREVDQRTEAEPRIAELAAQVAASSGADKARLRTRYQEQYQVVRSEKLGQVAEEFDRIHSVERALEVGSVHRIIPPAELRPYLVDAIERGMARAIGAAEDEPVEATAEE